MGIWLTDDQRALADAIADWASATGTAVAALTEAGLVMPHWPQPYGRGAGPVEQLVIDEELMRAGIGRTDIGIGAWAAPTILEHGDDDQRDRFTGQKVWTSMVTRADWGICLARTDPDAPPHKGITYFLLDMGSDGIDIRPLRELTGEELFNEVFLERVFVPDDCVVGAVDGGWPLARTTLANERVAMTDWSSGASVERALRVVSGRGVGEADRLRVGASGCRPRATGHGRRAPRLDDVT